VDRRFVRGSHLSLLTIIYNASRNTNAAAELETQIRITRDGGQPVVTSPWRRLSIVSGTDLARIPYSADIALQSLPPGRYALQVTVSDRAAKTSASQQITFEIE
jgi:hypothetical protein